jgi:hypothetical protein
MKPTINFIIIKEDKGYSAFGQVGQNDIFAEGDNYSELQKNILDAVNFTFTDEGYTWQLSEN